MRGQGAASRDRSLLGYFYRAFFRAREHELSIPLRTITFAAQVTGVLALTYVTRLWGVMLISVVTLAFGHRHAYRSVRDKPQPLARVGAFVALHLVFLWMVYGLFSSQPYPQAQLAMLAMAVVSWELFSRLNLYSGLGLALINLYVAATLSRDAFFAVFLLAYLALLLAFLWAADSEDGTRDEPAILHAAAADRTASPLASLSGLTSWGGRFGAAFLSAAALIFLFTPHYAGRPIFKPISFRAAVPDGPSSEIVNPAVPLVQIEGWSDGESDYYYGFDSRLDLSYRGGLSDTLMMYVRSPAWSYWRSHAYDTYDGRMWTQSGKDQQRTITGDWLYELDEDPPPDAEYFVQSFYIAQSMPNLIFAGGHPIKLYVAADEITIDESGGVRVGSPLEPGMVYSVLSTRQDVEPDVLRAAGTDYPPEIAARYLQVPNSVPDRVRNLAVELAGDAPTPYDQAAILRDYLLDYPYDFYPPPQVPGSDAVDQFLFVDRRGVCEQYVSAHVIMLRALGIPARLAAGYGSGDYNPITGYYEVRANDAHSWTEIYFPGHGWVPMDPTPGWEGDPQTGPVKRWVFSGLTDDIDLPRLSLGAVDMTSFGGRLLLGTLLRVLTGAGGIVLAAALGWGAWQGWRRWRESARHRLRGAPIRRRILRAYRRAQRRIGARRLPAQTAQEHAADHPELIGLADAVDIAAYRPQPPDETLLARVLAWRPTAPKSGNRP